MLFTPTGSETIQEVKGGESTSNIEYKPKSTADVARVYFEIKVALTRCIFKVKHQPTRRGLQILGLQIGKGPTILFEDLRFKVYKKYGKLPKFLFDDKMMEMNAYLNAIPWKGK